MQLVTRPRNAPVSDLDPWADSALIDAWATYAALQSLGAAVWLTKHQMFALTRYNSVIRALKDGSAFSSASGVMMNDAMNEVLRGNTLCSDGADHERLRRVIAKPLSPTALKSLQAEITAKADELVDRLFANGVFCAVTELASALPVDIVASAIGLPPGGREQMLVWAEQMFNCFGPPNDRTHSAFPVLQAMMHYAGTQAVRGKLKPGSWADAILDAVDSGEVDQSARAVMMIDYMGPSLDTTIYGIANGVWLFARHPEQWRKVCQAPSLVPGAINEILRMESPLTMFLAPADARLRSGRGYASGRFARHRVLWRGESRRTQVRRPAHIRRDAQRGGATRLRFGAAYVRWLASGAAGNDRSLSRSGNEGQAIPHRGGGP
jgi:cytochrome P450